MTPGGITFAAAAAELCLSANNGLGPTDPRVMRSVNKATREILNRIIPLNGMMTADVQAAGTTVLLPKEMASAIEVIVLGTDAINGVSGSEAQGFISIVNAATYLDPAMVHDFPMVDQYMQPDPNDATILRHQYDYPGLSPNAFVRVTGPKSYQPVTLGTDYLIVQNILALGRAMEAQERMSNQKVDDGVKLMELAIKDLQDEVSRYLQDPQNILRRRAAFQSDLATFPMYSHGWMRARLALEIPKAQEKGRQELSWILDQCEQRLMERGEFKDCFKEFDANVLGGYIYFPEAVEAVVAASLNGWPIDVRSILYKYIETGPGGWDFTCGSRLEDLGDEYLPNSDTTHRKYRLVGSSSVQTIKALCKLRFLPKRPQDQMTIRNYPAIKLMARAIVAEPSKESQADESEAVAILQREINEHLAGIKKVLPSQPRYGAFEGIGGVL